MIKTYSELIRIPTYEGRIRYLQVQSKPGQETFGHLRLLNQRFYTSPLWRSIRDRVIIRDNGFDLAMAGHPLLDRIVIHHINPILPEQLYNVDPMVIDLENLVSTYHATHELIHYGTNIPKQVVVRQPNDTCPWR